MKTLSQKTLSKLREAYELRSVSQGARLHWENLLEKHANTLLSMAAQFAKEKEDFDKLDPQEWR